MQVGGINIVKHHSFEAFNDTTRLKHAYFKHRSLIGSCTHLASDGIYPTNSNRRFCSAKKLQTNFVAKSEGVKDKNIKSLKVYYRLKEEQGWKDSLERRKRIIV
jgi:hypothetical protein